MSGDGHLPAPTVPGNFCRSSNRGWGIYGTCAQDVRFQIFLMAGGVTLYSLATWRAVAVPARPRMIGMSAAVSLEVWTSWPRTWFGCLPVDHRGPILGLARLADALGTTCLTHRGSSQAAMTNRRPSLPV
jgi:hypothetical protein